MKEVLPFRLLVEKESWEHQCLVPSYMSCGIIFTREVDTLI